jgi:hypothetical protein
VHRLASCFVEPDVGSPAGPPAGLPARGAAARPRPGPGQVPGWAPRPGPRLGSPARSPAGLPGWAPRRQVRRPGYLRHTGRSAESCCRQALTRFTVLRCAGPSHRSRRQDRHHDSLVVHPPEGCESGRIGTIGNRVTRKGPWVQIPSPPPTNCLFPNSRILLMSLVYAVALTFRRPAVRGAPRGAPRMVPPPSRRRCMVPPLSSVRTPTQQREVLREPSYCEQLLGV